MNTGLVLSIIIIALTVIALVIAVWKGLTRGIVKSSIRLASILLTTVAAVVLTVLLTPVISDAILRAAENQSAVSSFVEFISAGTETAAQLRSVVYAAVAPLVFLAAFLVSLIIFSIIYTVIASVALKKQDGKNGAPQKITGIILNIATAFIILSCVLFPVTYYAPIANEAVSYITEKNETAEESLIPLPESYADKIISATEGVTKNPLAVAYSLPGKLIANFTTRVSLPDDESITLEQLIEYLLPVYGELSSTDLDSLKAEDCYRLANALDEDTGADKLIGAILSEMFGAWKNGDDFMGMSPIEIGNETVTSAFYNAFTGEKVSEELRAAGNLISLAAILDDETSDTKGEITQLVENLTNESAETVKETLTKDVIASIGNISDEHAEGYSNTISSVLDELLKIKNDGTKTEEEKKAILDKETEHVSNMFEVIKDTEKADADKIIGSIADSSVLQETLNKATDGGKIKDPLGIADSLSDKAIEDVYSALEKYGIAENSDLYNQVMAFIGK